nr:MAG TPA: hypothetical protein [Caudoviricetes sp.]
MFSIKISPTFFIDLFVGFYLYFQNKKNHNI